MQRAHVLAEEADRKYHVVDLEVHMKADSFSRQGWLHTGNSFRCTLGGAMLLLDNLG